MPDDAETSLPPVTGAGDTDATAAPGPPPEIEGYEILGPLGEGGMGIVWRAIQQSTRREVALKVLGCAALASDKARARFEREVELASRLEHPHIARIYDSGLYHGLYYYAMELVDGAPLDEYAKRRGLTQRQVLALLETVCRAVQHAHQRGVIHRDLKPSNILVTADGQPHVLDFGLAKALVGEKAAAEVSMGGEAVGTPAYMSPEQAAGQVDRIDMRSDVFSLGTILYRLLTGQSPHDLAGTRYEVLRRVAEEEIRRPREAAPGLDCDLEALLLKALAKDPDARYASAGALADDIGNYLNGEPLSARPPTTGYFLRKRLYKHRGRVAAAVAMLAALVAVGVWSYIRVSDERQQAVTARDDARQEAAKSRAVVGFFGEMLASVGRADAGGRPVTVRDMLDGASREVEARFSGQPLLEAEIRRNLGEGYVALGEYAAAYQHLSKALSLNRQHLAEGSSEVLAATQGLAGVLRLQGKPAEAERLYRKVCETRRVFPGPDHLDTLRSLNDLAKALADQGKYEECLAIRHRIVERSRLVHGARNPATLAFVADLAVTLWHTGKRSDAERLYLEVYEGRRQVLGEDHPSTLVSMNDLAGAVWDLGRREESVQLYRQLTAICQRALGKEAPTARRSLASLGHALIELGQYDEAEGIRREELELQQDISRKALDETLVAMNELANNLHREQKYSDAEPLYRDVFQMRRHALGEEHPLTLLSKGNLANNLYAQEDYGEAEQLHREVFDVRKQRLGEDHADTLLTMLDFANVLLAEGKYDEAEALCRQAIEAYRQKGEGETADALRAMSTLQAVLAAQGKTAAEQDSVGSGDTPREPPQGGN